MIFVDTWAWLALANKKDKNHEAAKITYNRIKLETLFTSNFILDELITLLYRTVSSDKANLFVESLFALAEKERLSIIYMDKNVMMEAWRLRKKYRDKQDISFTDFTSFTIMEERGIKRVFTGDKHFEKVNMGFIIEVVKGLY